MDTTVGIIFDPVCRLFLYNLEFIGLEILHFLLDLVHKLTLLRCRLPLGFGHNLARRLAGNHPETERRSSGRSNIKFLSIPCVDILDHDAKQAVRRLHFLQEEENKPDKQQDCQYDQDDLHDRKRESYFDGSVKSPVVAPGVLCPHCDRRLSLFYTRYRNSFSIRADFRFCQ